MMKKIKFCMCIFCILFLIGCKEETKNQSKKFMRVPKVSYIVVKTKKIELTRELPGRVSSYKSAPIIPQVSGIIKKRLFKEGSDVKKGDLLYIIDPSEYKTFLDIQRSALKRSKSMLPSLEKRVKRYKELVKTKAISKQSYDDAIGELNKLKADILFYKSQIRSAEIKLNYCYIRAPLSGRISRTFVTEGSVVVAYQQRPLAIIQHFDPVYVDVPRSIIELRELKNLIKEGLVNYNKKLDENISLRLEDGTLYPYRGKLLLKEVTVDETTGSVILRLIFPNKNHELLPGMFVRAIFSEGIKTDAILIPQESVLRDPQGNPFVYVVTPGDKVAPRPIELDRALKDKWLVKRGLKEGDKVVVYGIQYIRPGIKVLAEPFKIKEKNNK